MKRFRSHLGLLLIGVTLVGCGGGTTNVPSAEFTEEEKAEIAAEDAAVEDEEMGGGVPPVKRKKQK